MDSNKENMKNNCPELVREFLFYMETIRGRSSKTVEGYYIDLRTFFRYIKIVKLQHEDPNDDEMFKQTKIDDVNLETIGKVTLNDVYEFLHFSLEHLKNGSASRSRKVSSIRAFYHYLTTKTRHLETDPVKDLEVPTLKKTLPKYLTLDESIRLLDTANTADTASSVRDYCILTLFLNCGMRVSELVTIDLQDIRDNTLKLLGKGNKERIIYLNDACKRAIDNYLTIREQPEKADSRNALFLSRNGNRLTSRRIEQIVEGCLADSGLSGKGYSPHKLRHTAATLLYQHGGVDIRVLKEILGHANLGTTEIYTHVSDQQIEKAAGASPLSAIKGKSKVSLTNVDDGEK